MSYDPNQHNPRTPGPGRVLIPFFGLVLLLALTAIGLGHFAADRGNTMAHSPQAPATQVAAGASG